MPDRQRMPLTRNVIAVAALRIIDREGLPGLSMRRIGAELGVEAMALYRYFPQKDAILTEVVDVLLGQLEYPRGGDWRSSLRLLSLDLRAKVLVHPNAMPLVAARWLQARALAKTLEEASAQMRSSDVDVQALLHALMSFVLGYCWLEVGAFVGSMPEEGGLTRRTVHVEELPARRNASAAASQQFEKELEFLLVGAQSAGQRHGPNQARSSTATPSIEAEGSPI